MIYKIIYEQQNSWWLCEWMGRNKCDLEKKKLKSLEYCLLIVSELKNQGMKCSKNWSLRSYWEKWTVLPQWPSGLAGLSDSVFRQKEEAQPSSVTLWPSPSTFKHGCCQHTLVWAGLLTFALTVLGRLWKTPDHGSVSDRISCVNWWLGPDMLHWIWSIFFLNSCSFKMKICVLKW